MHQSILQAVDKIVQIMSVLPGYGVEKLTSNQLEPHILMSLCTDVNWHDYAIERNHCFQSLLDNHLPSSDITVCFIQMQCFCS
jgi:hypothetical protein